MQLVDGNDVFKPNNAGESAFRAAVARIQDSPKALPGRIGVVGFSLGGGAALTKARACPIKSERPWPIIPTPPSSSTIEPSPRASR